MSDATCPTCPHGLSQHDREGCALPTCGCEHRVYWDSPTFRPRPDRFAPHDGCAPDCEAPHAEAHKPQRGERRNFCPAYHPGANEVCGLLLGHDGPHVARMVWWPDRPSVPDATLTWEDA